jgi:hypothetical protein
MDAIPTKEALEEFRTYLARNVISWPPTPAQSAEIQKGGTLELGPDMCPEPVARTRVVAKVQATDNPLPYTAPTSIEEDDRTLNTRVVRVPNPAPACPTHKVVLYRGDEKMIATAGGAPQCRAFIASPAMDRLRGQGWTHMQMTDWLEQSPDSKAEPIKGTILSPRVRASYVGHDVIEVGNARGERKQYRIKRT